MKFCWVTMIQHFHKFFLSLVLGYGQNHSAHSSLCREGPSVSEWQEKITFPYAISKSNIYVTKKLCLVLPNKEQSPGHTLKPSIKHCEYTVSTRHKLTATGYCLQTNPLLDKSVLSILVCFWCYFNTNV